MKKSILTFLAAVTAFSLQAQNISPGEGDHTRVNNDEATTKKSGCCKSDTLSGWTMDFNVMVGALNQNYTANSPVAGYTNLLNPSTSSMDFHNGVSYGFELQGGYFFGKKRNWGVGLGLTYLYQTGNVTMDQFHAEYAAYDNFANVFRQEVTANGQIKEKLHIHSFNIPVVLKYQTKFSKKVGFTADAGILFNLHVKNNYTTNASFDYEAIYRYVGTGDATTTLFDGNTPPASGDLLITKGQYLADHTSGSIQDYFNAQKSLGYNVGLGERPTNNSGSVSYTSGSFGLLLRPAISIELCKNASLNLGVYYYYQYFSNVASSNYHITDKVGQYSSMLNTVTNASNNSYGITVGVRYTFCKKAKKEQATAVETTPAPEPEVVVASPVEPDEPEVDHVDISTPLLFDLNKVVIKESSIPILEAAVRELKSNPDAKLTINGYTDNTGTADYNKKLSRKRAAVVKNYLKRKGVNPRILKTVGHGESNPAGNNRTREGRMRNRRVIMKVKE